VIRSPNSSSLGKLVRSYQSRASRRKEVDFWAVFLAEGYLLRVGVSPGSCLPSYDASTAPRNDNSNGCSHVCFMTKSSGLEQLYNYFVWDCIDMEEKVA
jgi:hypothetical protein